MVFGNILGGIKAVPGAILGAPSGVASIPGAVKDAFSADRPPGEEERLDRFRTAFDEAGKHPGFQINPFQNAMLDPRVQQGRDELIRQLQTGAAGQGPSVATDQFNRSLEAASANQLAQASSGVGNRALAARQAAQNIGGAAQGFAGQAAMQRIQEQLLARQQLAGVLDQAQNARFGASAFNANQQNQRALQQALLNQRGLESNRAAQLGFGGLEVQQSTAQGTPSFGQGLLGLVGTLGAAKLGQK